MSRSLALALAGLAQKLGHEILHYLSQAPRITLLQLAAFHLEINECLKGLKGNLYH